MEGRKKRLAVLLVSRCGTVAVVVVVGDRGTRSESKSAGTLDIYGYGPGDDVQENRANYAAASAQRGRTIKRKAAGDFNDQAFLRGWRRATCPTSSAWAARASRSTRRRALAAPRRVHRVAVKKQYRAGR